ncbi:unnamed protein product [Effrenium voratum]|nr:unnamed protein product [Effrenium voratum]
MDRLHLHVYIEFHKAPDWTCKVRVGFVGRLKQVEAVQLREQQQAFQGEKAAADAVLETLKRPFKQHVLELGRRPLELVMDQPDFDAAAARLAVQHITGNKAEGTSVLDVVALDLLGRKWRLRWGVRRKTLQPEGYIEPEELRTKVRAFWHTLAHVSAKYSHKQIVFLNLDETSVGFNMTPLAGCVAAACVQRGLRLRAKVKKENLRGAMSYVALICDSAELQGKLPHYLIGSTVRLTKTIMKGIAALPATQLRILRRKSAWNTSEVMVAIIKDVSKTLQPVLDAGNVQPVLLLDCAPAHLPLPVMQAASDCGIQLLFIPSSCTHIAQPLDIRAFAGFKMYLKKVHRELRAASAEGLISPLAWIWHLTQAPRQFFAAKKWKPSFEAVGAGGPTDLSRLHKDLKQLMGNPTSLPAGSKPTPADLACIWPKRRRMAYACKALF